MNKWRFLVPFIFVASLSLAQSPQPGTGKTDAALDKLLTASASEPKSKASPASVPTQDGPAISTTVKRDTSENDRSARSDPNFAREAITDQSDEAGSKLVAKSLRDKAAVLARYPETEGAAKELTYLSRMIELKGTLGVDSLLEKLSALVGKYLSSDFLSATLPTVLSSSSTTVGLILQPEEANPARLAQVGPSGGVTWSDFDRRKVMEQIALFEQLTNESRTKSQYKTHTTLGQNPNVGSSSNGSVGSMCADVSGNSCSSKPPTLPPPFSKH